MTFGRGIKQRAATRVILNMSEHECPVCGWQPDDEQPYPEDALIYHYERTDHNPKARE